MTGKITIEGKEYPLRFGMGVVREIQKAPFAEFEDYEAAIFLIWHAHLCYCNSRQTPPMLEYWNVVDFVECTYASDNQEVLSEIARAVNLFNDSIIIKDLQKESNSATEADKKKVSLQTTNDLPTGSLV